MKERIRRIQEIMRSNLPEEKGETVIQYALITTLISAVAATAASELGAKVRDIFQTIADALPG